MEDLKKGILIRNNVAVGAVGDKFFSAAPIGVIQAFSGNTIPYGYLLADGASYPTTEYPDLYAVIGNTYGGDSTNFNVPNLVDKFIQGSTASGTEKEAGLPNITGSIAKTTTGTGDNFLADNTASGLSVNGALSIKQYKSVKSMANGEESYSSPASIDFDASKSNAIYGNSDTVQPPALTMVYIIKAFHTNEGTDSGLNDETIALINQEIEGKVPSVEVQEIEGGHSLTITDKNGEETFEVLDGKDGKDGVQINDSATNTTSVWSSSKTKSYVDSGKSVTILASSKSSDTGWNLKRGTNYDFGRLLLVSAYNDSYSTNQPNGTGSELLLIMGDYETATVTSTVIAKTGKAISSFYSLEVSSSGTLVIKTTTNLANSSTGKGKARLSFMFLN